MSRPIARRLPVPSFLLAFVAVLAVALPGVASAESKMRERHDRELERWVFSGALEVDIYGQTGKGSVRGTPISCVVSGFRQKQNKKV